jgi:hypothetical protein
MSGSHTKEIDACMEGWPARAGWRHADNGKKISESTPALESL